MKKLKIFLLLIINWSIANGQTGPVFEYTHPSKEILKELAKGENAKGYAYRMYLINKINLGLEDTTLKVSDAYIDFIFNHLNLEEVYLKEGNYINSGYDSRMKKIVPSIGHEWQGFCWVLNIGSYSITLIKEDCGNILTVPVVKRVKNKNTNITKKESNDFKERNSEYNKNEESSKTKVSNFNSNQNRISNSNSSTNRVIVQRPVVVVARDYPAYYIRPYNYYRRYSYYRPYNYIAINNSYRPNNYYQPRVINRARVNNYGSPGGAPSTRYQNQGRPGGAPISRR